MVAICTLSSLGKSAVVTIDCITQAYENFVILHGAITVAAANGDKLVASYTDSFAPTGGTGFKTQDVTYSINGSIGRFERRKEDRTGEGIGGPGDVSGLVER